MGDEGLAISKLHPLNLPQLDATQAGTRVTIRPAYIDRDLPAMLAVLEIFNMHRVPSEEMAGFHDGTWFVADANGSVVGVCGFGYLREQGELIGKTKLMVVDPKFGHQGIGLALQKLRMKIMQEAGAARVRTCCDRPEVIAWYKRHFGYREVGHLPKIHEFGRPDVDSWTVLEAPLTDLVVCPATRVLEHDPDGDCARELAGRLRSRYIGAEIARGILALAENPQTALGKFGPLRARWESSGGFVEAVTQEQVTGWVTLPSHLVVEASPSLRPFRAEAQAIFTIPHGRWVVPLLGGPHDQVRSPELLERILEGGPAATAWIDYLSASPRSAGAGLAGLARHAGMIELIERHHAVRQVVGASFAVRGIETGTRRILLEDLGQSQIANTASLRAIGNSRRCPAHLLGISRSGPGVPVEVDGNLHHLLVDWIVFVRLLEEVQPLEVQAKAT